MNTRALVVIDIQNDITKHYRDIVDNINAAIDTLQKYKKYLTFGQGEGGMLAGPFFFGVSAENIPNVDSMQVMMNVVLNEGKKTNAPVDVMAAVRAIANVYVAHYDAYLKNIYPQVKADMEERRQMLSQRNSYYGNNEREAEADVF